MGDQGLNEKETGGMWQSVHGQRQAEGFLIKPSVKKVGGFAQSEQIITKNNDRVADMILSFKRTFP